MLEFEHEPDVLDVAARLEAREREACVAAARNHPAMVATGFCRDPACQEPLPPGQLFCGEVCRDYYEKVQRMKLIQGRR